MKPLILTLLFPLSLMANECRYLSWQIGKDNQVSLALELAKPELGKCTPRVILSKPPKVIENKIYCIYTNQVGNQVDLCNLD